jgi:integrase
MRTLAHKASVLSPYQLCDINNPEDVKAVIAKATWKKSTKQTVAAIMNRYYKWNKIEWEMPIYKRDNILYFIPLEEEIDALINAAHIEQATRLQALKELAARIGELLNLKWTDLDTVRKLVTITAEKGSNSRILPISDKLISMLNRIPKTELRIFPIERKSAINRFCSLRTRVAERYNNPRFKQIHLHTFRHWKATMWYHEFQNIYEVKMRLGHKSVVATEVYMHIEQMLYRTSDDKYTCKTAKTTEEAISLIESGFEMHGTIDGTHIYRKRK